MREESDACTRSTALLDEPAPRSPWRVSVVEALTEFRLRVVFVDGLTGAVDLSRLIHSPQAGVFGALKDPVLFAKVALEYGAVTWPGGLDLAPDAMYLAIQEHGEWRI